MAIFGPGGGGGGSDGSIVLGTVIGGLNVGEGNTRYLGAVGTPAFNATEAEVTTPIQIAGTLSLLSIRTAGVMTAGGLVATVRVNGADTALTVTIPVTSAIGTYTDSTHTVALTAGDLVAIKFVKAAGDDSAALASVTLVLTP